jgi:hypothetical protein
MWRCFLVLCFRAYCLLICCRLHCLRNFLILTQPFNWFGFINQLYLILLVDRSVFFEIKNSFIFSLAVIIFFLKGLSPVWLFILLIVVALNFPLFWTFLLILGLKLIIEVVEPFILVLTLFKILLETLSPLICFLLLLGFLTLFIFFGCHHRNTPSRCSPVRCIALLCLCKIIKAFIFIFLLTPDSPKRLFLVRCGIISVSILEGPVVITHI